MLAEKEAISKVCEEFMKCSFNRDDYKELVELTQTYLGNEEADKPIQLKRPGALHKARWMAKLLY